MKTLMIATALSTAMLGSALAQSTTAPATPAAPANNPMNRPLNSTSAPMTKDAPQFVEQQMRDQWLASKFKGTDVVGTQDEKIGDVNDVLFDRDGKVVAYVVGVGGFLGIGQKDVALSPSSFQFIPGQSDNEYKLRLSMTKEQLETAAAFETKSNAATTTGSGTSTMAPRPTTTAPAPMNPPR